MFWLHFLKPNPAHLTRRGAYGSLRWHVRGEKQLFDCARLPAFGSAGWDLGGSRIRQDTPR